MPGCTPPSSLTASYHLVADRRQHRDRQRLHRKRIGRSRRIQLWGSGASGLSKIEAATDASFSLNGIPITSGSNTVSGVVPGLTLNLTASGAATVTVSQDVSALDQAANGLVSALNNVLQTINQYSSYSPTSGAGPLLGDVGLQILRSNLLSAITSPANGSALSTPYGSLSAVGFTINSDGTVSLNDQAFQTRGPV